jgi:alcohol dehydrogenase class IV
MILRHSAQETYVMKSAKYKFFTPTQLLFGEGCAADIGQWIKAFNGTKVLLVTDKGLVRAGLMDDIKQHIIAEGLDIVVFDEVAENPTEQNVSAGRDLIIRDKIDIVVGLGGGSPMDAAKAMAVLASHPGNIADYELGLKPLTQSGLPVIVIPTTAGTGSEATMGSVITDQKTHRKFDVVSRLMAPQLALVDPLLTRMLPAALTAATGMDALTHAIEGYTATLASPLTDALHLKAITMLGNDLPRAYHDGSDRQARSNVMMASMIAGIGFPNSGLGAVHGLTLPLGGHFGIPHGIANAIMLPHVMQFNLEACPDKFVDIANALGAQADEPEQAVSKIIALRRELQIPLLSAYNINRKDLDILARDALGRDSNCVTNPRKISQDEARTVYLRALEEK